MFLYRNVLAQAWKITRHYRYLWFFGVFVALLGNGGETEIILRGFDGGSSEIFPGLRGLWQINFFSVETLDNIGRLLINDPASLLFNLAIFLLTAFLAAFIVWLVMVSQAGLVHDAASVISGRKHDFRAGLAMGMKKFWPVCGLNVSVKIIIYILLLLISLPVIAGAYGQKAGFVSATFVISFLLFVPLAVILSFIVKYAVGYAVIKGNHFVDALRLGWKLFAKNWLISIEMAFLLFFINLAVSVCLVFLVMVMAIPFLFAALLFIKSGLFFSFWVIIIFALMTLLAVILLAGAGLAVFQTSAWTGLFIELTGRGATSKLSRMFGKNR